MVQDCLIHGGTLLDPETGNTRRADILIKRGRIVSIGEGLNADGAPTYDATARLVSPGWMDMHVHLREPGGEHKETIETGCRAAAFGGFTAVACMPNTDPPIDTSESVVAVRHRAEGLPVDVHPIGCVSQERAGTNMAPLHELAAAGAVAFSDDGSPVQEGYLMRRALEYSRMLDRVVINHMEDLSMGASGHMNEGVVSTRLGLVPVPYLSEESMIARDVQLAELTGGLLHVAHISTAAGVDLVRQAKQRGVRVTAEACPHHFALTDEAVESSGFSSLTKMHPPLRTADDVEGIKQGFRDGTIDVISTDHAPHADFEKDMEFTEAANGIIGLETAWGLTGRHLIAGGYLSANDALYKLTVAPRRICRLPVPRIEEGAPANLTVFDATTTWTFEASHIRSKARNTPFLGEAMVGRAWAIYNNGQLVTSS